MLLLALIAPCLQVGQTTMYCVANIPGCMPRTSTTQVCVLGLLLVLLAAASGNHCVSALKSSSMQPHYMEM